MKVHKVLFAYCVYNEKHQNVFLREEDFVSAPLGDCGDGSLRHCAFSFIRLAKHRISGFSEGGDGEDLKKPIPWEENWKDNCDNFSNIIDVCN